MNSQDQSACLAASDQTLATLRDRHTPEELTAIAEDLRAAAMLAKSHDAAVTLAVGACSVGIIAAQIAAESR